ncbi:MAG TPA: glycosyltransferase [Gemmatimonadaceae bacterium]|jgi:glycosyltransferase involved in cell wall biosynthesis|nr:glycosyltransferase [Gemmatimonadaceae bacterium]
MRESLFSVVSFEGTDPYSQAGGLGVRVSGLARTLAELRYETHLFFIGDPHRPGEERTMDGYLTLHRWAQWISINCLGGVYDGEEAKVRDLTQSLPQYLLDRVVRPAIAANKMPVVLFEEWQTAECACIFADLLAAEGLRDRVVIFWTANNSYGFQSIDWPRLSTRTTIATISRYMRSIIRSYGADAVVIPNGIPADLLERVSRRDANSVRRLIEPDVTLFFKMARWEREKGWSQALGAVSELRERGRSPLLLARSGGPSSGSAGIVEAAAARGLRVAEVSDERELMSALATVRDRRVEVINLRFGVNTLLARKLFAASDAVLANSVYEPFGLVGLEAMAAGGVIYTGGTGEDYAVDGRNAVVLETLAPDEIVGRWEEFSTAPARSARIRRAARQTAKDYSWQRVAAVLLERVAVQAARQGAVKRPVGATPRWLLAG